MRIFYILIVCFFAVGTAQEISEKENRFDRLQDELILLGGEIDTLNSQFNLILNGVDQLKSRPQKDEKKIAAMMARGLTVSQTIEKKQERYAETASELTALKRELSDHYTRAINENRKRLEKTLNKEDKENIEQELFLLAGKRLIVSPVISGLKFNPEKIKQIDLNKADDVLERAILKNYLETALANIDSNISLLTAKEAELEESKKLQEKADLFIDDVANSRIVGVYEDRTFASATQTDEYAGTDKDFYERNNDVIATNQSNDYSLLRRQMQEMGFNFDDKFNRSALLDGTNLSEEKYLDFIKKGKEFLKQYRTQLIEKLRE